MKGFLKLFLVVFAISAALTFSGCNNSEIPLPETNTATELPADEVTAEIEAGENLEGEISNGSSSCSHSYTEKVLIAATCQKEGLAKKTCSLCGKTQSVAIPKTAHAEVTDAAIPATCTSEGKTEGKHCSVCKEILVAQETVAALGHTEVIDEGIPATCTSAGISEGKHCSVCGTVTVAQKMVTKEHTIIKRTCTPVTCEREGSLENYCTECKEVLSYETVPAGHYPEGHAYSKYDGLCTEFKHGDKCSVCKNYLIAPGTYTNNESAYWTGSAQFNFEYYNDIGVKQTASSISRESIPGKGDDGSGGLTELKFDNYVAITYYSRYGIENKNYSGTITITEENFAVVDEDFYNAFSLSFEKGEYTLSGTYEFDDCIWTSDLTRYINSVGETTNISFTYLGTDGTKYTATSISVTGDPNETLLINYDNFVGVYSVYHYNEDRAWSEHIQRYVTFETPQKASKEFFEWFTSVAAKVVA